jgi:O-antigen/teichoic acid export membrane protein
VIITITRFANFGLMLVSPIVLVRFLTVEQFGVYREFLLYTAILTSIAAFNINNSLMYFVPGHPRSAWRFVHQSTVLVALFSVGIVALIVIADRLSGGALVGGHVWALAAYTLCFVNVDFWEYLWLAQRQSQRVLAYTVTRLALRLAVVVTAALVSGRVETIIWSLVGFEAARLVVSFIAWRMAAEPVKEIPPGAWKQQIDSALPLGASLILMTGIRNIGSLFVTRLMGPAALAQYTVGTYVAPIVVVLRNSISDALLPEMSARQQQGNNALVLWQKSTVIFAILLFPVAVLLARFAEPIIVTLFSEDYLQAVPVFQIYSLLLVRECVDFGVLIRALDRNRLLVSGNILALVLSIVLLPWLVTRVGLTGAVAALLVARFAEGAWQLWSVSALCNERMTRLLPWGRIGRVAAAALIAAAGLLGWHSSNLFVIALAGLGYLALFAALLWWSGVEEARLITQRLLARRK